MAKVAQENTLAELLSYFSSGSFKYDYVLEIAKGKIKGHSLITKFGHNEDVDTGAQEDLWNVNGLYVPPTQARIHNIVSTDAADNSADTGARSILVYGVNSAYNRVTEVVTLNGLANVPTVNEYLHIHLMQVYSAGSGGVNVGNITATAVTDATVTCYMDAGEGQSASSVYLVPAGHTAYVMRIRARMNCATASSAAEVALFTIPFNRGLQMKTVIGINNSGASYVELDYTGSAPYIVPEKSWIKLRCMSVTNNNTNVQGEYDLILVDNNA